MTIKSPIAFIFCLALTTQVVDAQTLDQVTNSKHPLPAFTAQYNILHKSDVVGNAVRQLSYQGDGKINYHYQTKVKWLIFSQKRSETSILSIDGNQVTPHHYTYRREGTGKDKHYEWLYNAKNNTAQDLGRNRNIAPLNFSGNLQDKLSYHLQHRLNLIANASQPQYVYKVVNTSGTIADHVYQYDGEEELMLPYGLIKTVRFKREVKQKKRITYAWFAPELDYILVKLYQIKSGNSQFEAQLSSLEINEKTNLK